MRALAFFLAVSPLANLGLFSLVGCGGSSDISCLENSDCLQGKIPGRCLRSSASATSWCGFPDGTCPSGLRWGVKSGDGLASTCVDERAIIDAGSPDALPGDAAAAASTTMLVATYTGDLVLVYDATTLQSKGSFALPDPGNDDETYDMTVSGGSIWIQRKHQVFAYDPTTFLIRPGFPKVLTDENDCTLEAGLLTSAGVFCPYGSATSTIADDGVRFFAAPDLVQQRFGHLSPAGRVFGDNDHLVVTQGNRVAVLDASSLMAVPGSPVTSADPGNDISWGAVSNSLNRFALSTSTDLELFATSTLSPIGTPLTYEIPGDFGSIETIQEFLFDEPRHQLIIGFSQGRVGAVSTDTGVERVAPIRRGDQSLHGGSVDTSRGHIVFASGTTLVILDAETLEHVTGSPLALPEPARAVAFY